MHKIATPILKIATLRGPRRCAREPALGEMNTIGSPKRLMLSPMKICVAPRSERKIAQMTSNTPIVIQNAAPMARHDCIAGNLISSRRMALPGGVFAAGTCTPTTNGKTITSRMVSKTKVSLSPNHVLTNAAITGPMRNPAVS